MNPGESAAYAARMRLLLPIMDAHARGEIIEYKQSNDKAWKEMKCPHWGAPASYYRIKPAPRTFYAYRFSDGSGRMFSTQSARDSHLKEWVKDGPELLTLVEVL